MTKLKKCDGYLGCRTTKKIQDAMTQMCGEHKREVSEVINYLCRIFIEDFASVRTRFFGEQKSQEPIEAS